MGLQKIMETRIWANGPTHIIIIQGEINFADSFRLKDLVMKMIEKKVERFIINTDKITSIDSSGIGAFIYISSTLKKLGMSFAIVNSSGAFEQVIDKTKLASYLPLFKNTDEAINNLAANEGYQT